MQIRNSIFLVTGGASGLGAASARMAAENGAKVVIADLQVEAGEKLAKEIGGRFVRTDVSSEADGKADNRVLRALPARWLQFEGHPGKIVELLASWQGRNERTSRFHHFFASTKFAA